jgi:plasmid replication initiation protein
MSESTPIKYDDSFCVVQANELIRSKQDELSLMECKLIRLAIAQVLKDDTDLQTYSCKVNELARFLGISEQNIYRDLQKIEDKLMKRLIYIKDFSKLDRKGNPGYKKFHWVETARYFDGVITYRLSKDLKPYLVGLDRLFTEYGYEAILGLPTSYSIRLYELIASYQKLSFSERGTTVMHGMTVDKNEYVFTIEYLREYFNCEDKYPNTGDFIKRVINSAVEAIQKNTSMRLTYQTMKSGKAIGYVIFKTHAWSDNAYQEMVVTELK